MMRAAGRVVHAVLSRMKSMVSPGVTTAQLSAEAEEMILKAGGEALFKGVVNPQAKFPFPAALCTSVNAELVHGIPNDKPLKEGDIVSVDCGVRLSGYCGDSAVTIAVGAVSRETRQLMDATSKALDLAISMIRPGRMWSEIATAMQKSVEAAGFSVVREYVGHGIGREMHEEPKVPNYWSDSQKRMDFKLLPRMVLAVEPMVNLGGPAVEFADRDRWIIVTKDRKPAAHFEHTVAVTDVGADVLTDGK